MGLWDNQQQSGEVPKPVFEPANIGGIPQMGNAPAANPANMWGAGGSGEFPQDDPTQPCMSNLPKVQPDTCVTGCPISLDLACVSYHMYRPMAPNLLGCLTPAGTPPFSAEAIIEKAALLITENICNPTVLPCFRVKDPTLPAAPTINELVESLQGIICNLTPSDGTVPRWEDTLAVVNGTTVTGSYNVDLFGNFMFASRATFEIQSIQIGGPALTRFIVTPTQMSLTAYGGASAYDEHGIILHSQGALMSSHWLDNSINRRTWTGISLNTHEYPSGPGSDSIAWAYQLYDTSASTDVQLRDNRIAFEADLIKLVVYNSTFGYRFPFVVDAPSGDINFPLMPNSDPTMFLTTNSAGKVILAVGSGSSGAPALTATHIGFGDGSNLLAGSSDFTWDNINKMMKIGLDAVQYSTFEVNSLGNLVIKPNNTVQSNITQIWRNTTSSSVAISTVLHLVTSKPAAAVDGLGAAITFSINDTGMAAGVSTNLARIGSARAGANDTGGLSFLTYTAGVGNTRMKITPAGSVHINRDITAASTYPADDATLYVASGIGTSYNFWAAGTTPATSLSRFDYKLTVGSVINTYTDAWGRINAHSDASIYGLYVKAFNSTYATRIEGDIYNNRNTGVYINKCSPSIRIENSTIGLYYYSNVYPLAFTPAIETSWAIEVYVVPPAYGTDYPALNHAALKIREYTPNYVVSIGTIEGANIEVRYLGMDTVSGGARATLRKMYGINLRMGEFDGVGTPGYVTDSYFINMVGGPLMDDPFYYTNVWGIYSPVSRAMHYLNSKVGIKTLPSYASNYDLDINGSMHLVGAFYDGAASAGTAGQVLTSTGTGTAWGAAGSGPVTLAATQIGFGNASNVLSGSVDLVWNDIAKGMTVNGTLAFAGTPTDGNLWVSSAVSVNTTTAASYMFGGATTIGLRVGMRGSNGIVLPVGASYGSFVIGAQTVTKAASGTHTLLSQMVIKPLTIAAGSAVATASASLFVEGAGTGAVTNYSLWVGGGTVRLDSPVLQTGILYLLQPSSGLYLFNTTDTAVNYERFKMFWVSNVLEIGTEQGGSGSGRSLRIGAALGSSAARSMIFNPGSYPLISSTIGASIGAGVGFLFTGTYTGSAVTQTSFHIGPVINASTTSAFISLLVQPTITTIGSGANINIHSLSTFEQLRLSYDAANYASFSVNAAGILTIAPTGGSVVLPAGTISNANLANSSMTINGTSTSLGGTRSVMGTTWFGMANLQTIPAAPTTQYILPIGMANPNGTESNRTFGFNETGVLSGFHMFTSGTQPGTGTLVLTLRKNAVDTAMVITIAAGSTASSHSNLVDTVTTAPGDLFTIKVVNNATGVSLILVNSCITFSK